MRAPIEGDVPGAAPHRTAKVIDILPYLSCLAIPAGEVTTDPLWGDLLRLALDAWTWRDPESMAALEEVVTRLRALVAADWR